mmetsp:Transcript_9907/g.18023  ORF Transcript_9907/g.18023 Transcript_9907/m.18023 type:complete len:269 (+) Transcript_9907:253-1059(+)
MRRPQDWYLWKSCLVRLHFPACYRKPIALRKICYSCLIFDSIVCHEVELRQPPRHCPTYHHRHPPNHCNRSCGFDVPTTPDHPHFHPTNLHHHRRRRRVNQSLSETKPTAVVVVVVAQAKSLIPRHSLSPLEESPSEDSVQHCHLPLGTVLPSEYHRSEGPLVDQPQGAVHDSLKFLLLLLTLLLPVLLLLLLVLLLMLLMACCFSVHSLHCHSHRCPFQLYYLDRKDLPWKTRSPPIRSNQLLHSHSAHFRSFRRDSDGCTFPKAPT